MPSGERWSETAGNWIGRSEPRDAYASAVAVVKKASSLRVLRMASTAVKPRRRPVSTTERTSAKNAAPQSDRKQLVTLRKVVEGRRVCSELLLVGGTRRLVTKTKKWARNLRHWRRSLAPAWTAGSRFRAASSRRSRSARYCLSVLSARRAG